MAGSKGRGIVGRIWEKVCDLLLNSDAAKAVLDQFQFVDGKLRTTGEDGGGGGTGDLQEVIDELVELNGKVALDDTLDLVATEATLELVRQLLVTLNAKDYATETTLSALKLVADNLEALLTSLDGKDFATETTLNSIKTVLDAVKLDTALLDVNLSTRASETTLNAIKLVTDQMQFTAGKLRTTGEDGSGGGGGESVFGDNSTVSTVALSDVSATVLAANTDRKQVYIYNDTGKQIWIFYGTPAVFGNGIVLERRSAFLEDKYRGQITAIMDTGNTGNIQVTETEV